MSESRETIRLRNELGFQSWEAIRHFLTDGDYLGFNEGDFRAAIREYAKAYELLKTPWQRQVGGVDILVGIAEFAIQSGEPELAIDTLARLEPLLTHLGQKSDLVPTDALRKLAEKVE